VIVRWDIEPGDAAGTAVRFPRGTRPVAIWVGGRQVPFAELTESPGASSADRGKAIVEVPFALTGLAQSLVVVCELVGFQPGQNAALPSLVDIGVDESWLTVYRPVDGMERSGLGLASERSGWELSDPVARFAALAESVAKVTQASVDGATDRTTGELVAWLTPWDARVNQLSHRSQVVGDSADGSTNGQRPPEDADNGSERTDTAAQESVADAMAETPESSWSEFRVRWQQYTTRITGGEWDAPKNVSASSPRTEWSAELTARHAGAVTQLPTLETDNRTTVNALASRLLPLAAALVLGGWLTWFYRAQLAISLAQPAFWLFLLGLTALPFAPLPVALAICLVAASGPWLANRPSAAKERKPRFGL